MDGNPGSLRSPLLRFAQSLFCWSYIVEDLFEPHYDPQRENRFMEGTSTFFLKDYETHWIGVKVFVPEGSQAGEVVDVMKTDTHEEMMQWVIKNGGGQEPFWVSPEYESRGYDDSSEEQYQK